MLRDIDRFGSGQSMALILPLCSARIV